MVKLDPKAILNEKGTTLVLALFVLGFLGILGLGLAAMTALDISTTGSFRSTKAGFYSGEAGLETGVSQIMKSFNDLTVYTNSSSDPNADSNGYLSLSSLINGNQVKYKITNPLKPFLYTTPWGATTLMHWAYTYDVESQATTPDGRVQGGVREQIRVLETPMVQFYIYYGGSGNQADLEWLPGPSMNSWGRVHTNGDLYIGVGGGNTLAFRNYDSNSPANLSPHTVTAVGSIYRSRKNDNSPSTGTVSVKVSSTGTTITPYEDVTGNITQANWATEKARFKSYLNIGVTPYNGTPLKSTERNGFYEQRANAPKNPRIDGIKILGRSSDAGGIRVYVSRPAPNTDVTALVNSAQAPAGTPVPGITPGTIVSEGTSQRDDKREEKPVTFTRIDLNLLERWYVQYLQSNGLTLGGDGILIYASRTPTSGYVAGSPLQAIRLAKSATPQLLDETTFTTDNPVYIEGNFNTVSQRGAAIVADAINILSNNWAAAMTNLSSTYWNCSSPGNANTNSCLPRATATTINACFGAGNVPTPAGGGNYSGGLENYPRFHETWSGITATINGCFINLGPSLQAIGIWGKSAVYSAPVRDWGWDIKYQNPDFWPPLSPTIFSVERIGWKE